MHNFATNSSIKKQVFKRFVSFLALVAVIFFGASLYALDVKSPQIAHPIKNPKMYTKSMICPNCGMMVNMWARTRHTFTNSEGNFETCSIRCLADMSVKAGARPKNAMAALYTAPETMVPVDSAFYVVGSSAKGTMTMKSKIAFASRDKAEEFAAEYGGDIKKFPDVLKLAGMEADKMRGKIQNNRMKKGKISEPTDSVSCENCGMYPAKYPDHRSQLTASDGTIKHYCSTKCMVSHIEEHKAELKPKASWVTVYSDGDYEYAKGLYYVVGSSLMGPMGPEAIPFRKKSDAQILVGKQGGKIVRWAELTPELISAK